MTTTVPGLDRAPTTHRRLLAWVREMAELTTPDQVVWCDGSDRERDRLTTQLVHAGTLVPSPDEPDSLRVAADPADTARIGDHTYVCSRDPADAGPAGKWMDPVDMKIILTEQFRGAMRGRTMYVVPFRTGPLGEDAELGVQITDSVHTVVSMRALARTGTAALAGFVDYDGAERDFLPYLHSVGAPLAPGQADVPWPCDHTKYLSYFPEERMVWSYGSGHDGAPSLGRQRSALRIASALAREDGRLAEHMLILKLTGVEGTTHFIAAAFPPGCGRTTLATAEPTSPGWQIEALSHDVARLRFGDDGRLYAVDPVAATGGAPWGVPISAILFGGRRGDTVPLITEARNWQHGVFLGATLSTDEAGVVRRNPMAMLPLLGYHLGDYLRHWLDMGTRSDALPAVFLVNWFRRGADGRLLWPGFGENLRVLRWVVERVEGTASGLVTPIGYVPTTAALDLSDVDAPIEDVRAAIAVDDAQWRAELPLIRDWFDTIGDRLPSELRDELHALTRRLAATP
nr:phosphoenolpyruvate carboxykinase (GTP) [Kutzneria chonburiensis]